MQFASLSSVDIVSKRSLRERSTNTKGSITTPNLKRGVTMQEFIMSQVLLLMISGFQLLTSQSPGLEGDDDTSLGDGKRRLWFLGSISYRTRPCTQHLSK